MLGVGLSISKNFPQTIATDGVAPSIVVAPVASVPFAIAGQTISCSDGTWSGTEPITKTFQLQSSANGVSGWSDVGGATSNSYLIPTSSAQLLFYRWAVTSNNGIGAPVVAYSNVVGGVDAQGLIHFNRTTADSGVMTYGLVGVDTRVKQIKFIYNVTDITTLNIDGKWLDWFGYKPGLGIGATSGRALNKAYSILGANFDYVQSLTTAQPLLGAFDGTNKYLIFPNVSGNQVSTPNNAAIQLTNDFEIEFQNVTFKAEANQQILWSKGGDTGSTANNLFVGFLAGNTRLFMIMVQGTTVLSYITPSNVNSASRFFKVCRNATTGLIEFYQSATSTFGAPYHTVTGVTGAINAGTTQGIVGDRPDSPRPFGGSLSRMILRKSIGGAISADFDMQQYNRVISSTSVVSGGLTWTFNLSSAATGFKLMAVDQTMAQGNGTSTGASAPSATLNSLVFTQYNVWRKFSNAISSVGLLTEYGSNVSSGQGMAFAPNEVVNCESVYTNSNVGLSGTSWVSNSLLLKVSTFKGNILGSPYEQALDTNNVANTFNAVQAAGDNTTAIVATGKNLGARNNASSLWLNFIWVGELMTTQTDTPTQEAAIYNMFATGTNII